MSNCALSQNESETKTHTATNNQKKKTQQMNADWPVYHDITDRRRSLVHMLCCVIIELKQNAVSTR